MIARRIEEIHAAGSKVSLTVRSGEINCLLGDNGAGKSTLIKVLSGAFQPDGGEILLDGAHNVAGAQVIWCWRTKPTGRMARCAGSTRAAWSESSSARAVAGSEAGRRCAATETERTQARPPAAMGKTPGSLTRRGHQPARARDHRHFRSA